MLPTLIHSASLIGCGVFLGRLSVDRKRYVTWARMRAGVRWRMEWMASDPVAAWLEEDPRRDLAA